ncbi:tetratricopeptide repeat protein [Pseudanabaena sp. PCC 6802]|uniref:tetratricopeptide repeat protein n=1 Tax=Pseudanabaena sp. PCC 6802 TaxID=118173 RepID=UPI00034DF59C|nr:tetratricopeptide repeat protein [Pseudanabaena sp. PCC 6802]
MTTALSDWEQQAQAYFLQGNYSEAVSLYEQAIASNPNVKSYYWQLGLLLLLQGQEEEAQMVWFDALSTADSEAEMHAYIAELIETLDNESQIQANRANYQTAWSIRQYIHENQPENVDNLLQTFLLHIKLDRDNFSLPENTILQEAISLLPDRSPAEVNGVLLLQVVQKVVALDRTSPSCLQLIDACVAHYQKALADRPETAEWHYRLGTIYAEMQQHVDAIAYYNQALQLDPNYAEAYFSLGNIDLNQGNYEQAIANYQTAIQLNPIFSKAYINLAYVQERQEKIEEAILNLQKALEIQPDFVEAHRNLGVLLLKAGRDDEAIARFQRAIEICPTYAEVYRDIGDIFLRKDNLEKAVDYYQRAIQVQPNYGDAYWQLIILLSKSQLSKEASASRKILVDRYALSCGSSDPIRSQVAFIGSYLIAGMYDRALEQFLELENQIYEHAARLTPKEIQALYTWLLIAIPHLRDDLGANSQLSKLIGELYTRKVLAARPITSQRSFYPASDPSKHLKIGFISPNFARNAVGWLCFDVVCELSQLTPHIYLYATGNLREDDRTEMFARVASKLYRPQDLLSNNLVEEILMQVREDELDVLVDLDSVTMHVNPEILYQQPAPVCISWLGFDAPFITARNYYLSDRYLHPEGTEAHYCEQIVRVPDLCVAISGLEREPACRDEMRHELGISAEQVAYLTLASGRKFTPDMVKAQVSILKYVTNSVLIHKAITGDPEIIQLSYQQECAIQMVDFNRIKFIKPQLPEEKHRTTYIAADVMLDSYPYNGGTHTIEGLWFDLPLVTRTGSQTFMGRVGYACLTSLGIAEGVSWSWEEYTDWGIKFGLDSSLRVSVRERMVRAKQIETLAPLWNPKKLARDMYDRFRELRFKQI